MADNGIDIAPARRSATAKLANRMLTGFCSSFLRLIAMITNKFKRIVTAEAIGMMTTKIQRMVVFFKSQIKPGNFGQKNTDLVFVVG